LEVRVRILIAAADILAAASTEVILAEENLICDTTDLGEDGLQMATVYNYDLILLDLMAADIEGYKMLQRLRAARVHTPILILSARGELDQKVKFLRFGADDFLTKPFDGRELIARILAIVRRCKRHSESAIRTGEFVVNLDTRVVSVDDQPVLLTGKEYAILELLSLRKGTTVTKEVFLNNLYGGMDEPDFKIIDVYICKLRKKLAQATGGSHCIETVWGCGYVLREPAAMPAATLAADPEDLGARRGEAGTRTAAECIVGQTHRPSPQGVERLGQIDYQRKHWRDGVSYRPVGRSRADGIGPGTKPTRDSSPVELWFEDTVTTDGGPLHLTRPDPVRSLFGCTTARCHE
jgi:two-component system cell cycle response regulator CtrA